MPIFYPTFGGGPLRFLRYQPGLRKRDIHARVLAGTARTKDDFHPEARLDWADHSIGSMMPIEHIEGMPVHRVRLPRITSVRRTSTYFRALIALCEDPKTRPDVIQLHSFERLESLYWLWRLKRLDIPLIYAIQIARPVRYRLAIARGLKNWMLRVFYNSFDGVVTNSEPIRGTLRDLGARSPIAVIPNGVDLELFRRCDDENARLRQRRALGIKGTGPVLLSVGGICPRKGSDLLVAAWAKLLDRHPDTELVFVGPRHDRNNQSLSQFDAELRARVADAPHPDRVHFAGVRDDMNEVYGAADIVVLPSTREGMPNVALEAMACERPLVITPFDGQSSAVGRPGVEFEQSERSPALLARTLASLLDDSDRRAELVRNGRAWVTRHLDLQDSLDQFAEFYARAADRTLCATELRKIPSAGSASTPLATGVQSS